MKNKLNKQPRSETVLQFFYPTSDNWAGNFDRNTVSVSLYAWHNPFHIGHLKDGIIRMVVSGNDDTMMEKEFRFVSSECQEFKDKIKELTDFLLYKLPNPLTKQWLSDQGFING